MVACENSTTTISEFSNPNTSYCVPGTKEGVYTCQRVYTSYFDTQVLLKLYVDETYDYDIEKVFTDFQNLLEKYHKLFDKYNAYEGINNIFTINNSNQAVTIDEELFIAIEYAINNQTIITADNQLLFNIALNPVLQIWHNARNSNNCDDSIELGISYCPIPETELNQDFNIDPNDIILDKENFTIAFSKENMGIDLGGFAKGYISEIITEYLNQYNNIKYLLNLGNSNVHVHGINNNNDTGKYYIALTRPSTTFQLTSDYYKIIELSSGQNLVTSGNYQRFFKNLDIEDKTIYHHIIDPRTYYPADESMAVTVLSTNGAIGDILSTALFLMDIESGLAYVNNIEGLEAIWYVSEDEIYMSDNFSQYIYVPEN
jgi:thiamine biosynthesis lipoprotein